MKRTKPFLAAWAAALAFAILPPLLWAQVAGTALAAGRGALAPAAGAPAAAGQPPSGQAQLITEPEDGRGALLDAINGARKSIDITIYELDDPQLLDALIGAHGRGVRVRVLYNYYSFQWPNSGDHSSLFKAMDKLQAAGVETRRAGKAFMITHQKTMTMDGAASLIMDFNMRASYFSTARGFGYLTRDPALVSEIAKVFNADWDYVAVSPSAPQLVWSPDNSRAKITGLIDRARVSLDIYNQEAKDKETVKAIADAARHGVKVRMLTAALTLAESSQFHGDVIYTAGMINAASGDIEAGSLQAGGGLSGASGADANQAGRDMINAAGGEAKAGTGYYIHAKVYVADGGAASAQAFLGSENCSASSLDKNRELGVLISDPALISSLKRTFEKDWSR